MKKLTKKIVCVMLAAVATFSLAACNDVVSAYDIAVKNGFSGTEAEWLESLKGETGASGKDGANAAITAGDLYDEAVKRGYTGTYLQFVEEYLGGGEVNYSAVINENLNCVVSVKSTFTVYSSQYYGRTQETGARGAGVFYKVNRASGDAYVITNYHVIYESNSVSANKIADKIELYLYGQEGVYVSSSASGSVEYSYPITAEYIGGSMTYDIAVLRVTGSDVIKNSNAQAAKFTKETDVTVGSTAIAIGNPGGGGIAASLGIVSKDSEYITMTGADDKTEISFRCMRVDCAINPGNSGGGLFNGSGELIGIVNAKVVESTMENIGYAIPASIVTGVAENVLWQYSVTGKTGVHPKKAIMGVTLAISNSSAVYDPLTKNNKIVETVTVTEISSALASKSFMVGDKVVLLTIGEKNYTITRMYHMIDAMLGARPGEVITIAVLRDGKLTNLEITLAEENFNEMA